MPIDVNLSIYRNPSTGWLDPNYNPDAPVLFHGALRSITVVGAGTKTDYNTGNYTFAGHRHMHRVFTDFDTATTTTPAANTEAGWKTHLQGIYPIITSDDFNVDSVASGRTFELVGSPTQSGKWLRCQTSAAIAAAYPANYRLRNWNLFSNTGYKGRGYLSCYFKTFIADDTGKFFRIYWDKNPTYPKSWNFYTGKPAGDVAYTWRVEGEADGQLGAYADQTNALNNSWQRHELVFDFDADQYAYYVDGVLLTDTSNSFNGIVSGNLGAGRILDYGLLGNTVDPRLEDGHFNGYSMPVWDFDTRRIEIADSAVWASKTKSVICPNVSWSSDNIQFVVNQGDFSDLTSKHIFYVDGFNATYVGALE